MIERLSHSILELLHLVLLLDKPPNEMSLHASMHFDERVAFDQLGLRLRCVVSKQSFISCNYRPPPPGNIELSVWRSADEGPGP